MGVEKINIPPFRVIFIASESIVQLSYFKFYPVEGGAYVSINYGKRRRVCERCLQKRKVVRIDCGQNN